MSGSLERSGSSGTAGPRGILASAARVKWGEQKPVSSEPKLGQEVRLELVRTDAPSGILAESEGSQLVGRDTGLKDACSSFLFNLEET